jgi:hypothetical protein
VFKSLGKALTIVKIRADRSKAMRAIIFAFVVELGCMLSSVIANADVERYAVLMTALGEPNAVLAQKLADPEESLVATGTPRPDAQEVISAALRHRS